jgi:CRISPR/Cas system-associated protein Cas10 (large subunit of type III CRISPR-Cas system)
MTLEDLKNIYPDIMPYPECGDGWAHLLEPVLEEALRQGVILTCIKAKFGALRIYTEETAPIALQKAIEVAEYKSEYTCESCGEHGSKYLVRNYWLETLCDECAARCANRTKVEED